MGKQYNAELQAKVEAYMKETGVSQAKLAPMMNLSGAVLSQYRRSVYDKGDVEDVERKIREFFQIKEEQAENAKKTEPFNAVRGYVATSISESIYKMIRYCQLEKGIVVIDGDAGIGKTKAATKFLRDNPATAIYISTTPSTSSVRSLLRMIARALKISENQRTEDLSISIRERLRSADNVLIIDEATDTPEKIIHDTRLSAASIFDCGMFIDEKGDLYVTCWGSYGYVPDQKFGLLRIKKGATEFDPDYCFNMTDMNVEGVQGGKLQYSISNFYAGNGELYVLAYCPAFASASPDYINEKTNYCLKADLYHCTMKALNLPRTNGYSCAINKYGDDILFGLATEQNGTGIFTYNRKTDQCSSAPVVKTQGTLMDILVFE